jgi:1-acyl-sn-glycerol-3-phosphate acyltransferase
MTASTMFFDFLHRAIPPAARAIWRPRIEGVENIPRSGPVLIASNHLSFFDSVVIPVVVPRKVVFLAKAEYFEGTGIKGRLQRGWFEGTGMVPVNRDDTRSAVDSLQIALDVLAKGEAFGLYPEGTRSRDGRLYRGKVGVAELALRSGAPIVPTAVIDTEKLQPVGSRFPKLVKVTVRFAPPVHVAGEYDGVAPGRARRQITDRVMEEIQRMSGQELAGTYNERPADS